MGRFVLLRLARGVVTLWIAVTAVFFALRLNVSIAELQGNLSLSAEAVQAFNSRWGLDRTPFEQYLDFLAGLASFDLGLSFRDGRTALEWIAERIPGTLLLGAIGFTLTVCFGVTLGITAALNKGGRLDAFALIISSAAAGLPSFVIALALVFVFALSLPLLPSGGHGSAAHLVLPALTYCFSGAAGIIRHTRSNMIEQLTTDYVRAAFATGASRNQVTLNYALRNALGPIVTVIGLSAGGVVGHAIVIETVFSWPGLGSTLIQAAMSRDLAVVQAIVMLFVVFMISVNLLVDLICLSLSPKLR